MDTCDRLCIELYCNRSDLWVNSDKQIICTKIQAGIKWEAWRSGVVDVQRILGRMFNKASNGRGVSVIVSFLLAKPNLAYI